MKELTDLNDETLFQLLKQSDARVFDGLQKLYSKKLLSIAYYVLNDKDEAYDVLQDTYIYLWEKRESLQISSSFINYVAGAVRFRSIDEFRKRVRQERNGRMFVKESDQIEELETRFDVEEEKQHALYINNELRETIDNMRNYNRRTAFKLRYLENKELIAISEEMGYPVQTIRNWLAQGMKYLRGVLQDLPIQNRIARKFAPSQTDEEIATNKQTEDMYSN
jgi:RNA polymerase sigma factor (sigma-70 family)